MLSQLAPEIKLLILNASALAVAYLGIYPSLSSKTMNRLLATDLAISIVVLTVSGAIFAGSGIKFSMILFQTNWLVFGFVTLMLMETPLFLWFARKHNIDLGGPDA